VQWGFISKPGETTVETSVETSIDGKDGHGDDEGELTVGAEEESETFDIGILAGSKTVLATAVIYVKESASGDLPDNVPENMGVQVVPQTVELKPGGEQEFGTIDNVEVTWSLKGNNDQDTVIDSSGLLTVGEGETAEWLTVRAAQVGNKTKYGTAVIRLLPETPDDPQKYYVRNDGNDSNTGRDENSPLLTINAALAKVNAQYAVDWPGKGTAGEQRAEIVIFGEVQSGPIPAINNADGSYPPIILRGETGGSLKLNENGSLITVEKGVTLTLRDITLTSKSKNNKALTNVSGGHLILEDDAVITGNNNIANGGGVYVTGGTFTKTGGVIYGDSDHVYKNGNDTDNTAQADGNAAYVANGAKIRNATADEKVNLNSGTADNWDK
jgi:hypothetical protein